jgi:hypothetical protein
VKIGPAPCCGARVGRAGKVSVGQQFYGFQIRLVLIALAVYVAALFIALSVGRCRRRWLLNRALSKILRAGPPRHPGGPVGRSPLHPDIRGDE